MIKKKKRSAFTLVDIMVVMAIIALIAAIGVPAFLGAFADGSARVKQINIAQVEAAKEQWALLNNQPDGATVTWEDIQDYMKSGILSLDELDVGDESISINVIGTTASYSTDEESE